MARKKRSEPVWPLFLLIGVVAGGLAIGRIVSGGGGTPDALGVDPVDSATTSELPTPESRVTVEVLNGGGIPGMASRATEKLRERGFDVVYFGNESSFDRASSVVVERVSRDGASEGVARALGISEIRTENDTTRLVDLTVLIGADWDPDADVLIFDGAEADRVNRPWWDLRRWVPRGTTDEGR